MITKGQSHFIAIPGGDHSLLVIRRKADAQSVGGVWARQSPSRDLPEYYFDHGRDRLLAAAAPVKKGLGVPARLEFGWWAAQENKVSHKLRLNPALLRIGESYTHFFHLQSNKQPCSKLQGIKNQKAVAV